MKDSHCLISRALGSALRLLPIDLSLKLLSILQTHNMDWESFLYARYHFSYSISLHQPDNSVTSVHPLKLHDAVRVAHVLGDPSIADGARHADPRADRSAAAAPLIGVEKFEKRKGVS